MNDTPRPDATAPDSENPAEPKVSKPYVDPSFLVDEAAEMKNKLLRALADMENLRKRTEREVADARQYGIAAFARDILGVADNFRRALESVGPELRDSAEPAVTALVEGVELTERDLAEGAGKERHPQDRADGREIRSQPASGDVRGARSLGAVQHRGPGDPAGLCDRRAHPAAGDGRGVEGRPEGRAGGQ